ncbi:MAG: S41 family peptidase [Aggregatilineales bacterium]
MNRRKQILFFALFLILALVALPITAQDDEESETPPPAEIINDEGGPVRISGSSPVSSQNLIDSLFEPVIILEDQAGFVDRNFDYVFPTESQVIGQFTTPFEVGEVGYVMSLPIEPLGAFRDVDNDDTEETGVQIFQIAFWDDQYGEIFIDEYDGTGWSGAYSTAITSINPELFNEYIGGNIIVWAPDDKQGFPSGFGEDGLLFTEDDPIVTLPAGYTVVNMDTETFTFDRSREVELNLIEPDGFVPNDFSELGYADAFNALVDVAIDEYSFTEAKNVDWEALRAEFLPRFEEADANEDNSAYLFALRDFGWSIPDGHVQVIGPTTPLDLDFQENTAGGLGMAVLETSDGRFLVANLLDDGPAMQAGIELLAEITEVNGVPIEEALQEVVPYSSPFSSAEGERYQQLRYLFVAPLDTDFDITFLNPDATEADTVTLTTVEDNESFGYTSVNRGRDFNAPQISYEFLEDNIGYISVTGFGDDGPLLIETWEEFLGQVNGLSSPAVIVDLRFNGGGFSFFANRMASYFFTEETPMYYSEEFNPESGEFYSNEDFPVELRPPLDTSLIYEGELVVLVGPACASACEFFAYALDFNDRATVIGQYNTTSIAGGWPLLYMPDDIIFALPTNRDVDFDGNIILEGIGVPPEIRVPVTEETIVDDETDFVLEAALEYLEEATAVQIVDGGEIAIGDTVEGELSAGTRVQYAFTASENVTLDILTSGDDGNLDTYLRIYVVGNEGTPAVDNDDLNGLNAGFEGLDIPADLPLIIEVAGFNDAVEGAFTLSVTEFVPPEVTTEDAGEIAIGDSVEGELAEGVRNQYTLTVEEDGLIDISVTDEAGELDTYLRVYVDGAEEATFENDDIELGVQINSMLDDLEVTAGQVLVIEVGGFNDTAEGAYTLTVSEGGEDF